MLKVKAFLKNILLLQKSDHLFKYDFFPGMMNAINYIFRPAMTAITESDLFIEKNLYIIEVIF